MANWVERVTRRRVAREDARLDAALVATALAFTTWAGAVAVMRVDPFAPRGVQLMHPAYLAAGALLALGFVTALAHPRPPRWLLGAQLALLVVVLHLTPFLVEDVARFRVAWRNVGFAEYFTRHAHADPDLIWYHNWPAFFGGAFLALDALGWRANLVVGAFNTLIAGVIAAAAATLLTVAFEGDERRAFAGTWIVVAGNWINQEYFAPQPVAFALYLVLVAFHLDQATGVRRLASSPAMSRVAVVLLYAAISVMHPLTALVAFLTIAAFAVWREEERRIVLAAGLLLLSWMTYGAHAYVSHNLAGMVEEAGRVLDITRRGLEPSLNSSPEGRWGAELRLAFSALVAGLAVLGAFRLRMGREVRERMIIAWALGPLAMLGGMSYGGEILQRIFMFTLPIMAYVAITGLTAPPPPAPALPDVAPGASLVLAVALVAITTLHPVAHYAQEHLDYVPAREVEGAFAFTERAPDGSRVLSLTPNTLMELNARDRVASVFHVGVEWSGDRVAWTAADPEEARGLTFVWLTDGDRQHFELRENAPERHASWDARLSSSPNYARVFDSGGLIAFQEHANGGGAS